MKTKIICRLLLIFSVFTLPCIAENFIVSPGIKSISTDNNILNINKIDYNLFQNEVKELKIDYFLCRKIDDIKKNILSQEDLFLPKLNLNFIIEKFHENLILFKERII